MWLVPGVVGAALAGTGYVASALLLLATFCLFWARYPFWLWVRSRDGVFPKEALPQTLAFSLAGVALGLAVAMAYERRLLFAFGAAGAAAMVAHLALAKAGRDRSLAAEFLGIGGLCLVGPVAYYAGAGALDRTALLTWLLPVLFFGVSVFYVKLRVDGYARLKTGRPVVGLVVSLAGYVVLVLAVLGVLAALDVARAWAPLAYAPVLAYVSWPRLRLDSPPRLRRLGVMWTVHSALFGVLLIVLL